MPAALLSAEEISTHLAAVPAWEIVNGELARTFAFADFRAALAFVNRTGELAEAANHHPDIDIRYNQARLAVVTHSAGGLTAKDFALAAQIDGIVL